MGRQAPWLILRLPAQAPRCRRQVNSNVRRRMPPVKGPELKNICRIDIAANARGKHETHGWQFKAMRSGKQQTKFFADGIYGSREAALAAAQSFRREIFQEIGEYEGYWVSDILPSNNTSGIMGVHRSESIRQDESIEEVWQTTTPSPTGKRRFRAFNIAVLGERDALYKAVEERLNAVSDLIGAPNYATSARAIANLVETYLNILIYMDSVDESETTYLLSVINNKTVEATEKARMISGRVGQASFRAKLEKLWGGKCCVTGSTILLHASHIKPWAVADDRERLDPFNGFLLSPVYDKAFDEGLITFDSTGRIVLSSRLVPSVKQLSINAAATIEPLSPITASYLEYHRSVVYKP